MCGRYVLFADWDLKEIQEIIEEVQRKNETFKTGEIFPTDKAPILIQKQNRVTPEAVAWGFPHNYNKGVIINARVETVQERPMFRNCLSARRCVIPSTGFFEWSHDANKVKYRFNLPGTDVLYMAGLYNEFQGERRFVILTTAANFSMQDVHDRMPVVLDANGKSRWLEDMQGAMEMLNHVPPELMKKPA
ncbi:SOS response-associated peptidase [Caproiciproducens sp. NJN-50]|nr:SOS response-associated peptidase [Caproiciproducens sp. NJN-50]